MLVAQAYIEVTDAENGIAFYCDGPGLRLKCRLSRAGSNSTAPICPFSCWLAPATQDHGRHWTPVHPDFVVSDLDAMMPRLTALGGSLDREIAQCEYGRIANMADPFGNGFDLIAVSRP